MNRKERRRAESRARHADDRAHPDLLVMEMTDEVRQRLLGVLKSPEYLEVVESLARALIHWQMEHLDERPEWKRDSKTLFTGSLGHRPARDAIAGNESAHRALEFADGCTGHRASVLQAYWATFFHESWVSERLSGCDEKFVRTEFIEKQKCGRCAQEMSAVTSWEGEEPSEGDVTVCSVCTAFHRFDARLRIVLMGDEEFARLDVSVRTELERARALILASKVTRGHEPIET